MDIETIAAKASEMVKLVKEMKVLEQMALKIADGSSSISLSLSVNDPEPPKEMNWADTNFSFLGRRYHPTPRRVMFVDDHDEDKFTAIPPFKPIGETIDDVTALEILGVLLANKTRRYEKLKAEMEKLIR